MTFARRTLVLERAYFAAGQELLALELDPGFLRSEGRWPLTSVVAEGVSFVAAPRYQLVALLCPLTLAECSVGGIPALILAVKLVAIILQCFTADTAVVAAISPELFGLVYQISRKSKLLASLVLLCNRCL